MIACVIIAVAGTILTVVGYRIGRVHGEERAVLRAEQAIFLSDSTLSHIVRHADRWVDGIRYGGSPLRGWSADIMASVAKDALYRATLPDLERHRPVIVRLLSSMYYNYIGSDDCYSGAGPGHCALARRSSERRDFWDAVFYDAYGHWAWTKKSPRREPAVPAA